MKRQGNRGRRAGGHDSLRGKRRSGDSLYVAGVLRATSLLVGDAGQRRGDGARGADQAASLFLIARLARYNVVTELHVTTMALNIRNAETERLAAEVSRLTGETKTEAVSRALKDRLDRLRREKSRRRLANELDAIAHHCAQLPLRDSRAPDEILGYDERGLPSQ